MPSIIIKEIDNTSGGGLATELNVVYVPGFTTTTGWPKGSDGKPITTKFPGARIPTLCTTVAEFEGYFGTSPADIKLEDGTEDIDKSYIYAKDLIKLGLNVLYESVNSLTDTDLNVETMYNAMNGAEATEDTEAIVSLYGAHMEDKGEYNFKFLTSGAYPTFTIGEDGEVDEAIATKMIALASNRGDCVALIDHQDDPDIELTGEGSTFNKISAFAKNESRADYGAMFTPWPLMHPTTYTEKDAISMPPSFGYLCSYANSIKTNASWVAVAGAARGAVPYLDTDSPLNISKPLTNAIAEKTYQSRDGVAINAITNIKPFGYRIWGNRTLKNNSVEGNLTATSFLNIRNMISDIKKVTYAACKRYTFEQNNDVLWINFKAAIEPTLEQMKSGAGLSGYKIIKGTTTEKAKLVATIKLYPLYAVEDFEITVSMEDDEVSVS